MSWWSAKYKNNHGEYEITFGSKYKEKTKIVEKVCKAIIDKLVQSEDDIAIVRHGRWVEWWPPKHMVLTGEEMLYRCSVCDAKYADVEGMRYCPNCGAKMDGDNHA